MLLCLWQPLPILLVQLDPIQAHAATGNPRVPSQCEAMLGLVRSHTGSNLGTRDPHALGHCSGARAATEMLPGKPGKCSKGERGRAGQAHNTVPGVFQNPDVTDTLGKLRLNVLLF